MRIATGTVLTGIVLLASAVAGIEPSISFAAGIAALVAGAIALAVAMEARDQAALRGPLAVRRTVADPATAGPPTPRASLQR